MRRARPSLSLLVTQPRPSTHSQVPSARRMREVQEKASPSAGEAATRICMFTVFS